MVVYYKPNKKLFADTVSANKKLVADNGVPIEKNTLREEVYYMVVYYKPPYRVSANNLIL